MRIALGLAQRGLGRCWPNPTVGCVIVKQGHIIARGWTRPGGRPHAETVALERAGSNAEGATAYITLEPCAHHGQTPPCTNSLIQAGVSRVVIATQDPDPRTNGAGIARLKEAGITVTESVLEREARQLNEGFLLRTLYQRPLIALKTAATLDGKIATLNGKSQWITNEEARHFGHRLRAHYDAIMIGSGTLLADNPLLTCRLEGMERHNPVRIVLDTQLKIEPQHQLAQTTHLAPLWVITSAEQLDAQSDKAVALTEAGARLVACDTSHGRLTPSAVVRQLIQDGLTRLLIEGGPSISTTFLQAGLVDEYWWFSAPMLVGDDGRGAIRPMGLSSLDSARRLTHIETRQCGADQLHHYRLACSPVL